MNTKKPVIEYPCQWTYKVIGTDHERVHSAVSAAVGNAPHSLNLSRESSEGKYRSFTLEMLVASEEHRNAIHQKLRSHCDIKMVL